MDDLYRARFEGKVPEVRADGGTVTIRYRPSLHHRTGEITLAGQIPWSIERSFGMSDIVADLEDLKLLSWEISGGASKVEARLPRPDGESGSASVPAPATSSWSALPACRFGFTSAVGPPSCRSTTSPAAGRSTGEAPTTTSARTGTTSRSVRERARSRSEPERLRQGGRYRCLWPSGRCSCGRAGPGVVSPSGHPLRVLGSSSPNVSSPTGTRVTRVRAFAGPSRMSFGIAARDTSATTHCSSRTVTSCPTSGTPWTAPCGASVNATSVSRGGIPGRMLPPDNDSLHSQQAKVKEMQ